MTVIKNPFEKAPVFSRYPPSGINILVAGAGIAGLSFAIEAHRKGHEVCVIDRRPHFNDYGDFIAIQSSALRSPEKWPGFMETCRQQRIPQIGEMHTHDGQFVGCVTFGLSTVRSSFHRSLLQYAAHIGIDVRLSARVVDYFEDSDKGGVVLDTGAKITADLVVAADGIGSRSGVVIKGERDQPTSSGYAMLRATYPTERIRQNPLLREFLEDRSSTKGVVGPGAHIITGCSGDNVSWMLTHKDKDPDGKDRAPAVDPKEALQYVEGWVPWLTELIKATPEMGAVDYKLLWRDPYPTWASPHGRVVQIGDAAHAFLPTSASGATMAMEDAFSLAASLQLGGKRNLALAVKVHNKLRFQRVTCAQKMGFKNRQQYHETTFKPAEEGARPTFPMVGLWSSKHDPEQYVYEMYGKCANHILSDSPFENTNYPAGHTFKIWTVKEMREVAERGENIVDDGDWS
ncbi:hypothetical protein IWW34DRAFT_673311 [Fusarium oxysporum f. sp. albedinis]|nr:hypothetical protein BKA60DRAFT_656810 [Fusarium oxysporum]KAI3572754.1 hypothetical protein IWW34DRAFT_673311 [Fusarium oxysporum f. sp. albedinis]KAJ0128619.1 Glutamyl-tRNA(Gln) amidotransferase subunit A [Fusarium oxysporum f. sp. albedinis]KAK2470390.1 hypothetical protein H9L39_18007 [Fusarium oxysporum f. sp. albedinis]